MSLARCVLGGFLVTPAVARAQNLQAYAGFSLTVLVGREPGIGGGVEAGAAVAWPSPESEDGWGPVAGPFLRGTVQTGHPPATTVGARGGIVSAFAHDGLGYLALYEADFVVGLRLASRESALRLGGSVASLVGVLDVMTLLPPEDVLDPEITLGLRLPLLGGAQAGRPVRNADGAMVLPGSSDARDDQGWMARAREESSSVAEFVRIARSLVACGAPARLVRRALVSAEEEAGHAVLCAAMAARTTGRAVAVGSMPVPSDLHTVAGLAETSWVDGVIGEGRAASEADERSVATRDPLVAAVERRIAREEAGHAALSADIIRFCQG